MTLGFLDAGFAEHVRPRCDLQDQARIYGKGGEMKRIVCRSECAEGLFEEVSFQVASRGASQVVVCFDAGNRYVTLRGKTLREVLEHGVNRGALVDTWPFVIADFDLGSVPGGGLVCRLSFYPRGARLRGSSISGFASVDGGVLREWFALEGLGDKGEVTGEIVI